MRKNYPALIALILAAAISLSGCGAQNKDLKVMEAANDSAPVEMAAAPMIEEALESDYLRAQIENHISSINPKATIEDGHYSIGDLNSDGIPELVLFIERDPQDINDQGRLEVYGFNELDHYLIDSVPMNYDNTNYIIQTGMVSVDKQGILLSNQVGTQAGVTYGYILENGKLKSILNPKKINLVSVTANNSIEDINGDGILDFSIYTIDPETSLEDSKTADRILLWYNWDGRDGATVLQQDWANIQRSSIAADSGIAARSVVSDDRPVPGESAFIDKLMVFAKVASKTDVSLLLAEHIENLEMNAAYRSLDVATIFSKHTNNSSLDSFLDSRRVSNEQLNDREYLSIITIFQSEKDLKGMLLKNLDLGYKLTVENGRYEYKVDYDRLLAKFSTNLTNELKGYLRIISRESAVPHMINGKLALEKEALAERLVEIEKFRLTYSYSQRLERVLGLYSRYMESLLFWGKDGEAFVPGTGKAVVGHLEELGKVAEIYPQSYVSDRINLLLARILESNSGTISQSIKDEINSMIP